MRQDAGDAEQGQRQHRSSRGAQSTHPIALPVLLEQLPPQHILVRLVPLAQNTKLVAGERDHARRAGRLALCLCAAHSSVVELRWCVLWPVVVCVVV